VRTFLAVSLFALIATTGCKSKPQRKEPPPNVGSAAATGSGSGSGGPKASPDLILPRADGTPPKKTEKPLAKPDYERMALLDYPGFAKEIRTVGDNVLEVRHKTKDHPRMWATVTIDHCFDCVPMDVEKWKAKADALKTELGALKDSKDLEFEVGETKLNGQSIIYRYAVGAGNGSASEGGADYSFVDSYAAMYNDGVNQIRVTAAYKDDPVGTADLKRIAPKEDLRALALSFLDVYTHEWVK
jgi:hypothetical protein